MASDITLSCDNGKVNVRVGAIIMKAGKVLMVGNKRSEYLYSVGGRIKFGETAEEAVVREVYEETGVKLEIDRMGFIHENLFVLEDGVEYYKGMMFYELAFFFYMKVPDDFTPVSGSFTEDDVEEYLAWISPDDDRKFYPDFFKTELKSPVSYVKHMVTDKRVR